jgi:hypothetical protein
MFITKRLNVSSAGKLSDHDSGTWAGSIFQVGPRMSEKKTRYSTFATRNHCSHLQWAH